MLADCLLLSPRKVQHPYQVAFPLHHPPIVEPLTERERQILQLIAEGLTNKEIAHNLVLSVGTVKVHAHNIYGKLQVNRRTEAVARARELGLLS